MLQMAERDQARWFVPGGVTGGYWGKGRGGEEVEVEAYSFSLNVCESVNEEERGVVMRTKLRMRGAKGGLVRADGDLL